MGVYTLSAGKSLFQWVPGLQRPINQQVLIECLLLGGGHYLTVCKGHRVWKRRQSYSAASGFKTQPACLCSYNTSRRSSKCLRVASRRGESHLFFIPPLLYKHTRGSIDPSDGLDQYRSSFIANFYRKPTNDLLVFGEMFDCISTSTFVELLMLKNCFSCFNLTWYPRYACKLGMAGFAPFCRWGNRVPWSL